MINNRYDIKLEIHLQCENRNIDPKYLLQIFENLEASLYASDRKDVEIAANELRLKDVYRDACLERLRSQRHRRMIITDAKSGSLEFECLVAGVSYFILEKTIGEAFSDAAKQTEMYKKLKTFFKKQIDQKSLYIAENIRRVFASKKRDVSVKALPPSEKDPNIIKVDVSGNDEKRKEKTIKSLGEKLDKD